MATKQYTIQQKQSDGSMLTIHPETEAGVVSMSSLSGLANTGNTVKSTIERMWQVQNEFETEIDNSILKMIGKPRNTTTDTPGIATLDSDGKVPSSQLPSYVDDVLEYASLTALNSNGSKETGKIYVTTDTGKIYRWSGSTYVEISSPVKFGTTAGTAYEGSAGKECRDIVDRILTGAQSVPLADALLTSRTIGIETSDGIIGDSGYFDGTSSLYLSIGLSNTGIKSGTYSCVTVDNQGRATAGAQIVQVGGTNADGLAAGGIWFKEV